MSLVTFLCENAHRFFTLSAYFITKANSERFSGVQEASGVWRNAWTSICVIGSAAQPPPSPAVYSEILCTSPTVNLLTRLRFLHFFAEKLRSSSESRSRRQCWILMILVPHGSTSKIYKAAGLAWEHNKWEEVITRGHFDTSDITLSFRSTCTCVKAPLMQEPRLHCYDWLHAKLQNKDWGLFTRWWARPGLHKKETELHEVEAGRLDEVMKTRTSEFIHTFQVISEFWRPAENSEKITWSWKSH